MDLDLSQFDNLELNNIGQWPKAAKLLLCVFIFITIFFAGYMLLISDQIDNLERAESEEEKLKGDYKSKYYLVANLEQFKKQMEEAEAMFATQLKSLPESHETPGLLDDITFVGTTSGLEFVTLNWKPEIVREIYIELPIEIEVLGTYHSLGQFVSKIAGLPRIVTLHDFNIDKESESGLLRMRLKAKTYRYREAERK